MDYAVCPRCRGEGSHVNPSVDGHGITAEEMDELGPEFFEDYMGGLYDVACERCEGKRVVPQCAREGCTNPTEQGFWYSTIDERLPFQHCFDHFMASEKSSWQEEMEYQAEVAAERRMGA